MSDYPWFIIVLPEIFIVLAVGIIIGGAIGLMMGWWL